MNPELGMVPRLYFGDADPEYFLSGKYQKERWDLGIANKLYLLVAPDSQWDRTRAPAGRFNALLEEFTCPWRNFSEKEWLRMKREIVGKDGEGVGKICPECHDGQFYRRPLSPRLTTWSTGIRVCPRVAGEDSTLT